MKIYLDWVGCRLNEAEVESYAAQFRALGHQLVGSAEEADLVLINTCAVTGEAASDSRGKIRQAARRGKASIIATGCWATLDPTGAANLPNVKWVVDNANKDNLVGVILNMEMSEFDLEPLARQPLPGIQGRTRSFIKVQDGCDNFCTFCVTRLARGKGRSRVKEDVLRDVISAQLGGVEEVVLTGVHLGSWGIDLQPGQHVSQLVRFLLAETDIPRIRLSSVEPWDLEMDFWSLWENPRLCRHVHLPLQSGSPTVLQRMGRKVTPESFSLLVAKARETVDQMAITTDVIAGFPGETTDEFQETMDFIREMNFAGGHVFTFSPRPGTAAEKLPRTVPMKIRKERNAILRYLFGELSQGYQKQFLGQIMQVLWESTDSYGPEGWRMHGLTDNYLRVVINSQERLTNQITAVRLAEWTPRGLVGELVPQLIRTSDSKFQL